jgi:hypothetical protein
MSDLRPIGSERLQGEAKIKRIMEIATYGEVTKNTNYHTQTNSFIKEAANGMTYAIVKEKDGYYVKSGINESSLDYVDGLHNKSKNRFKSYSSAMRRLNLMLKPINEEYNNGFGDSLYEQEETDDEKFVLKVDGEEGEEEMDMDLGGDEEMDLDMDMDLGGEEDMDMDLGGEEDMDMDLGGEETTTDTDEGRPTMRTIQKLTGKLGQKLRSLEDEMKSEDIKYVLNSIISAVNLDNLDEEDMDDVLSRLEPEDEYGFEDTFSDEEDLDMGDEEGLDMDFGGEEENIDLDMGGEEETEELSESINKKVENTLKKYFKESNHERLVKESKAKEYLKETKELSKKVNQIKQYSTTTRQKVVAENLVRKNKSLNLVGTTKKGTLVFENKNIKVGVDTKGNIKR